MKQVKFLFTAAILGAFLTSCNQGFKRQTSLKTQKDSALYAQTAGFADYMVKNYGEDLDMNLIIQAIQDAQDSTKLLIDKKQHRIIVGKYQLAKRKKDMEKQYAGIKEDGLKFLEKNKTKEGVKTTASGLQYQVIKEGTGKSPKATDRVEVYYHGTTPEGKVFDSSVDRKETATFGLNQVIKGWTEGLQLMKEGAKYKFFIPQELAYGERGARDPIKPFMPLVFDVELVKVFDAPAPVKKKAVQAGHEGHNH